MRQKIAKTPIFNALKEYKNFKKDQDLAEDLGIKRTKLANWKNRNSPNLHVIKSRYPEIDANWLLNPEGPVKIIDSKPTSGIPLLQMDAVAGYAAGEFLDISPAELIYVPEFERLGAEFCVINRGDSMLSRFKNGDILGCRKVVLDSFFQWGRIFALDTVQGVIIKRVKPCDKKNFVLCVSDNQDFSPFEIQIKDIRAFALVIGGITLE